MVRSKGKKTMPLRCEREGGQKRNRSDGTWKGSIAFFHAWSTTFEDEYVKQGALKTIRRKEVAKIRLQPPGPRFAGGQSAHAAVPKCIPAGLIKEQENKICSSTETDKCRSRMGSNPGCRNINAIARNDECSRRWKRKKMYRTNGKEESDL
jgi:hypothetical protein